MMDRAFNYVIIGGGLAGASAVEGIRELDHDGRILLLGSEKHLPYNRPPLSKKLWTGAKKIEEIFVYDEVFYKENGVDLVTGMTAISLDAGAKTIIDSSGDEYRYEKLLLATGGIPRTLDIPGGNLQGVCYFRYLDDYLKARQEATAGSTAVVIGGGFIGSELAAALNMNEVGVTMVFPEPYLVKRVFPEELAKTIGSDYTGRGVRILSEDAPVSFDLNKDGYLTRTRNGVELKSDILIVGAGIMPNVELAKSANLKVENGIVVNDYLQTSDPSIYAAGDNARFHYQTLNEMTRVEHWDNALNQGKQAGLNMAGANEPYTYMPYFFSDLFDFGYEAVGDIDSRLETFADWQKENDTGVIYYLKAGKLRGAMMCNVWDKVPAARELIKKAESVSARDLRGAIT